MQYYLHECNVILLFAALRMFDDDNSFNFTYTANTGINYRHSCSSVQFDKPLCFSKHSRELATSLWTSGRAIPANGYSISTGVGFRQPVMIAHYFVIYIKNCNNMAYTTIRMWCLEY